MLEWIIMDNVWYPLDVDDRVRPIYEINTNGEIRNKNTGKILKPWKDKDGYDQYGLMGNNGRHIYLRGHRMVAKKFVPGEEDGLLVNHLDEIKDHNHYSNLEWCTNRENILYSIDNLIAGAPRGSERSNAIITEKEAEIICQYIVNGYKPKEILDDIDGYFGLEREQLRCIIKQIKRKNSWSHVSDKYF